MDMATLLKAKHNQGIAVGEERGEARGIEIGEARGIAIGEARGEARGIEKEALKRSLEMAKAMLNAGEPLERIKLYTQLSDDQITALQ